MTGGVHLSLLETFGVRARGMLRTTLYVTEEHGVLTGHATIDEAVLSTGMVTDTVALIKLLLVQYGHTKTMLLARQQLERYAGNSHADAALKYLDAKKTLPGSVVPDKIRDQVGSLRTTVVTDSIGICPWIGGTALELCVWIMETFYLQDLKKVLSVPLKGTLTGQDLFYERQGRLTLARREREAVVA